MEKAHQFFAEMLASSEAIGANDYRIRDESGAQQYVEIVGNNLLADSSVHAVVHNLRDITERKEAEEQLTFQANHVALTNLPSRILFMDRLSKEVTRSRLLESRTAVLFIDLDLFKLISDSLGHETGDILLSEAGQRILI